MNENMNYTQQSFKTKKKKSKLWIIPVILLMLIIAGLIVGYMYISKPENLYKRAIGKAFDTYVEEMIKMEGAKSYKGTVKLDVDLEAEEDIIEEEILDLINDIQLELGVQMNKEDKKVVVDMNADYDEEDLLDLKVFADIAEEKGYLYAKEYIDKYLEIDLEIDEESFEGFEKITETEILTLGQTKNLKTAMNYIKKEFANIAKAEYCSAEKTTQNINGKDVKTTKNTIKMTVEQIINEMTTSFENIKGNEKFLDLIETESRNELVDIIDEVIDGLKEIDTEGADEAYVQINTYTTGLIPSIIKTEVILLEDDEAIMTITVTKENEQKSTIEIESEEEQIFNGTFELTNVSEKGATVKLVTEIEELGNIGINFGFTEEYDVEIDEIDEDNVTNIEELTEDELTEIMENLEDSKLYELIEDFIGDLSMPAFPSTEDSEDDFEDGFIITPSNTASSLEDNEILTYDKNIKITFGIPSGYKTNRTSDSYQTIEKDDVTIDITTSNGTEEEYYKGIKSTKDYMLQQGDYKNVTLSDRKSATIGERKVYLTSITTETEDSNGNINKNTTYYIWTKVSDDVVLEMQSFDFNKLSSSELEEILTLTIEDNE